MNTKMKSVVCGIALAMVMGSFAVVAEPKGEKVTMKGEVIDLWCYLEGGDHGKEHKACGTACVKGGNPAGLLTEKGDIYVLLGMKDHQPGQELFGSKISETVTVEGTLVKKGGSQVIYASSIK